MKVGLIGAGNMARAIARGWGVPVFVSDTGSGRAQALVDELGGEAFSSNVALAQRVDAVVLCHKPYHLEPVAREISAHVKAVVSVLGATSTEQLQGAYPGVPVFALIPNTPVEVREGVVIYAERADDAAFVTDRQVEADVLELFGKLGRAVAVPERLLNAATAVTGVGPAYQALLAEAQVDAAIRHGVPPTLAAELVTATMSGSAALLASRGYDTLTVRREVTSPGGSTARGLDALERAGVRSAFQDAIDAVVWPEGAAELMVLTAAIGRQTIANYVGALFEVYIALILIYVLANLVLSFGARPPYSRAFDAVMGFLRDVSEPWLRPFRKLIPIFGGIDLSPMVAIFTLIIFAEIINSLISG